jgi:predicted phosphodiesterase
VRQLVISDLHLGTRRQTDLLRRDDVRARLLDRLAGVDRFVLLGDTVELRHGPEARALEHARPLLAAVGEALGPGREILVLAGNHDHAVLRPWLDRRRSDDRPPALALEEAPDWRPGEPLARLAEWARPAELRVAYPGTWLRDDVWATHGHYLDAHSAWPTFECLASALLRPPWRGPERKPGDYEAMLWPTYGLLYGLAQRRRLQRAADQGKRALRTVERSLGARDARPVEDVQPVGARWPVVGDRLRARRLQPIAGELRRPGVLPFARVLDRLGVDAEIVLFGHTHRTGPLADEDDRLWRTPGGTSLFNTGSWVYEAAYVAGLGPASPYWPGTLTIVDGGGSPQILRLLSSDREDVGKRT